MVRNILCIVLLSLFILYGWAVVIPLSSCGCSMAMGDLDQNGLNDLVVGNIVLSNPSIPSFTILYNFSNESFSSVDSSFVFGVMQDCIQLDNMNNDAYPDIVASYAENFTENQCARVFYNQNGTFSTYTDYPFLGNEYYNQIRTGDVNGDGLGDIVFNSYAWNYVWVLVSNEPNQYLPLYQCPLDFSPLDIEIGDVDNDGKDEIVFPHHPLLIFDYTNYGWQQIISNDLNYYSSQVQLGDVDNDGVSEIVTREAPLSGNIFPIRIYKIVNGQIDILYQSPNTYSEGLRVFDYNNDNLADYTLGNHLFTNNGNYSFSETSSNLHTVAACYDLYGEDINNDGFKDIILLHNDGIGYLIIYFGDGLGSFNDDPVAVPGEPLPPAQSNISLSICPNPFISSTQFIFSHSSKRLSGEIHIYNLKGQLVKDLLNNVISKASNTIIWDGKDNKGKPVDPGLYIVRVGIGNRVDMHKVMLLK